MFIGLCKRITAQIQADIDANIHIQINLNVNMSVGLGKDFDSIQSNIGCKLYFVPGYKVCFVQCFD